MVEKQWIEKKNFRIRIWIVPCRSLASRVLVLAGLRVVAAAAWEVDGCVSSAADARVVDWIPVATLCARRERLLILFGGSSKSEPDDDAVVGGAYAGGNGMAMLHTGRLNRFFDRFTVNRAKGISSSELALSEGDDDDSETVFFFACRFPFRRFRFEISKFDSPSELVISSKLSDEKKNKRLDSWNNSRRRWKDEVLTRWRMSTNITDGSMFVTTSALRGRHIFNLFKRKLLIYFYWYWYSKILRQIHWILFSMIHWFFIDSLGSLIQSGGSNSVARMKFDWQINRLLRFRAFYRQLLLIWHFQCSWSSRWDFDTEAWPNISSMLKEPHHQ